MTDIAISLDTVWMLLAAMLVFFMQPGFALCEAGFTRSKNTANILFKNFVDFMFGSLLFWFVGFGFMFGSDGAGFIGKPNWGDLSFYKGTLPVDGFLIFETVFCATSATIVSGAMAERTKFSMYVVYSAFISLFIYPIEGHWTWGGGWLCNDAAGSFMMRTFGDVFHDFAGSAIVHSVGGVLALIGALALGARRGKYGKDGKSRAIPGHSLTLAALGVFILWLGWFGFNPGSQLAAAGEVNRNAISHVFLTTNLSAAAGGVATMFLTTSCILTTLWAHRRSTAYAAYSAHCSPACYPPPTVHSTATAGASLGHNASAFWSLTSGQLPADSPSSTA